MLSPIHDWLLQQGFGSQGADLITMSLEVALVIVLAAVADVVAKRIVVRGLETLVGRTEYLDAKRSEITEWNQERNVDAADPLNGRRLTNVGTFRAYVVAYLRHHPMIRQDMTFLVRQLAPTAQGLPIEIYVFSRDQEWANYEDIQGDIFDHILAIAPSFDLRVYQTPSGGDIQDVLLNKPR